jgi:hypothetical protein
MIICNEQIETHKVPVRGKATVVLPAHESETAENLCNNNGLFSISRRSSYFQVAI